MDINSEKSDKKMKILIALLVILLIITLGLSGYILYDKVISKIDKKEEKKELSYMLINDDGKYNYSGPAISNNYYYVSYDKSQYSVIYNLGWSVNVIGVYNNRLYFTKSDQKHEMIKYINLNDNEKTEHVWLDLPEYECSNMCFGLNISKARIVGDTLYFSGSSYAGGTDKYDGVLTISMNASSFNEAKQLIKFIDLDNWFVDENGKSIYYLDNHEESFSNIYSVYKYIISEEKTEKIIASINTYNIEYKNGKILYYKSISDLYDSNRTKIYSCNCVPHYELYVYDANTKESLLLTKEIFNNRGSLDGIAQFVDNYIYYYSADGIIHQYDPKNNSSIDYYKISDTSNYEFFDFLDSNTLKIAHEVEINKKEIGSRSEYIKNKILISGLDNFKVSMLDGTKKTFNLENIIEKY